MREGALDRVLDRDNFEVGTGNAHEAGIEDSGLSRTSGSAADDEPNGILEGTLVARAIIRVHAQQVEPGEVCAAHQQAHHDAFSVEGGEGGRAHVAVQATQGESEVAVLGEVLLIERESGVDLDAGDQGVVGGAREPQ